MLSYKQRVTGSNPVAPTKVEAFTNKVFIRFCSFWYYGNFK